LGKSVIEAVVISVDDMVNCLLFEYNDCGYNNCRSGGER
jgi:hypothetical protein